MSDKKNSYPVNEVLGFCVSVKEMLNTYKTDMVAAKVDPTDLITALPTLHDTLNTKNIEQEGIKTALRDKTTEVNAAADAAYVKASQGCDMVITAFGRRSEQAREAMNLRKAVRPQKTTTTTPTPPPAH